MMNQMVTVTPTLTFKNWICLTSMTMRATLDFDLGLQASNTTLLGVLEGSFVSYVLWTNTGKAFANLTETETRTGGSKRRAMMANMFTSASQSYNL
jgi:hypothetical protein